MLIACALAREGRAVRAALRDRRDAAGVEVVVTGMGPAAAAVAAAQWVPRVGAVVVCGLAGGLGGAADRGDVVVASRLVDRAGAEIGPVVPVEVLGAVQGTVASVGAPVDDAAERAALASTGAVAVETEAAGWAPACAAAGVPLAVVRAVLDTPAQPLGVGATMVRLGQTGPGLGALAGAVLRPRAWPALLRLARLASPTERRAAEAAVRTAAMLAARR